MHLVRDVLGPAGVGAAIALAALPALASDPASLHRDDGLPPIGDVGPSTGGSTAPACHETYEVQNLVLDHVTVDGAAAPRLVRVGNDDVDPATLAGARLRAAYGDEIVIRFDYDAPDGGPAYHQEAFHAP